MSTDQSTTTPTTTPTPTHTTTPTPGIAGRYFVQERRKRFSNLKGRVHVHYEDHNGKGVEFFFEIENKDILSPRRLYRKFEEHITRGRRPYPYEYPDVIASKFIELTDKTFGWMREWSLDGFPYVHPHIPCSTRWFFVRMELWESDNN